ncbi:hypothetical protein, conserved [Eimeria tenella]|uniref:Glutaredoxin domain-containing protein n=1 Tax=Eimeria tenella TaxID=5802 RepID=H9B9G0_EIMTE|nr:hypothetical protein, conserved [Eimeria tenella]AET50620.1 hypothetical protein [Eimeria tenella]CDJ41389.1 hypothetical protein, conserved [Eimeria tenella]|eukprot:XP_013232139.1 hypothetical protein, conserved [Eimeria tenella]
MNFKTRVPRARGVNVLLLLINVVIILSIQGSAEAAVHEESGELIQTELQETGQELHNGEDASPARTPASDPKAASLERFAVEDGPYLTKQVREPQLQGDKKPRGSRVLLLNRIVSMGLLASIVVLAGLVFWEVYNYVGDTSDPLKNAGDASWVPAMIEDMLRQGKSLAFVVKKCKYCGIGLRALRRAGKDTVAIMVEGHPYQRTITRYLRMKYGARGFPFFIIDGQRYGYVTKIKEYLAKEAH